MNLKELREKVKEELKHIPKGPVPQGEFRALYWTRRTRSLGIKAMTRPPKSPSLRAPRIFRTVQ